MNAPDGLGFQKHVYVKTEGVNKTYTNTNTGYALRESPPSLRLRSSGSGGSVGVVSDAVEVEIDVLDNKVGYGARTYIDTYDVSSMSCSGTYVYRF